jgi:hypothetical protein
MAVKLAKKQTNPAMTTSRKSCSLTRQLNTRNMGRSGLRDKDCLEIARNHLFTVNFCGPRISGRDGTARACGKPRRALSISSHAPKPAAGRAFGAASTPGIFYVCLTIVRHC